MEKQPYEIWYEKYIDEMYAYGISFSLNKEDVLDIIHDVFLHLYEIGYDGSENTNIKFYLLCCMKNKIISFCRKDSKLISLDSDRELDFSLIPIYTNVFEEKDEQEVFQKLLNKAIAHLTNKQKEIIYLRYTQELTYEQVAEILHTTPKNVRKLNYRALQNLRENLQAPLCLVFIALNSYAK